MFTELQNTIKEYRETYLQGVTSVLEIGSRDVNGGVRQFFAGTRYVGIDMEPGEGVDIVMDVEECIQSHHAEMREFVERIIDANAVLCLETFEHMRTWFNVARAIRISQAIGDCLIVSTPTTGFPLHRYPKDYYRFMEDAYRDIIFKDYYILDLRTIHTEHGHPVIVAIGRKEVE